MAIQKVKKILMSSDEFAQKCVDEKKKNKIINKHISPDTYNGESRFGLTYGKGVSNDFKVAEVQAPNLFKVMM